MRSGKWARYAGNRLPRLHPRHRRADPDAAVDPRRRYLLGWPFGPPAVCHANRGATLRYGALEKQLADAKQQVQDIAVKAIEGASGAKALSHVNQIAMEQAKNRPQSQGEAAQKTCIMAKTYRDANWEFELQLPDGWRGPGFWQRWRRKGSPEFFGPPGDSIKFAIGPISPAPEYRAHAEDLKRIAAQHGHRVIRVGSIEVGGAQHATLMVEVPVAPGRSLRLKNYALIFNGIEYFATASLSSDEQAMDAIVRTFRGL